MKPCSSRNSLVWKPLGSSMRMVALMVRGPAKPISALGSAKTTSPSEAKLAATPPIVGLVSTEMNSPPAVVEAGQGGRDLGHLHQREHALVHARPAAGAGDDDQRQVLLRWPARSRG